MKRLDFIKKTIISGAAAMAAPFALKSNTKTESTYDKLSEQVGFNHMPNTEIMTERTVLHKGNTRGSANHGWLKVNHTFSFANYHNPNRMNFGVLRVLNDDTIAGGRGFNTHPHDNMEIITIPLEGDLEHKDNMGNGTVIKNGDIQVMSAGKGITHSEFNANKELPVKLLQIWLFPNKRNVTPRYDQLSLKSISKQNTFNQILSPSSMDQGVWIHQNAWFSLGEFTKDMDIDYKLNSDTNGVYAFIIEGGAVIQKQKLEKRDGFGIWNSKQINITAKKDSKILLMEVPMKI
ncbi:MAG: pirin family protein [Flavobacteriales bacterium]|nr:pirin family protein [Flavobacteriales bacterium]MBL6873672.1 pirin family protein [Flavobacteriales bacterium]